MSYLTVPFAWIMQMSMKLLGNYALALVAYALITRIIMFPLSIRQQKSSLRMLRLKPYQDALAKKYGNNRERYNIELQKLYQQEGYNPMSSCLPMLVQLPLLLLIYNIVRHPLTYIYYNELFTANAAERVYGLVEKIGVTNFSENLQNVFAKIADGSSAVTAVSNYELQIYSEANKAGLASIKGNNLFGFIDLSGTPSQDFWSWMLLIPILSLLTAFVASWVSQKLSPMQQQAESQGGCSTKTMMYMMPLLSLWISYTVTCALGFYWICTNVLSAIQQVILNKMYDPKKVLAEVNEKFEREKLEKKNKKVERTAVSAKKAAAIAASRKKK